MQLEKTILFLRLLQKQELECTATVRVVDMAKSIDKVVVTDGVIFCDNDFVMVRFDGGQKTYKVVIERCYQDTVQMHHLADLEHLASKYMTITAIIKAPF
jgi:hypothetical protein